MIQKYSVAIAVVISGVIISGAVVYTKNSAPLNVTSGFKTGDAKQAAQPAANNQPAAQPAPKANPTANFDITKENHVRGDFSAPITIVEFSDFECPFCNRFHPTVKQALEEYPDKVRWVYKHFPLSFHPNAQPAAEASECAAEQGKFWEFADGIFENQSSMGEDFYKELAGSVGVNQGQFDECVSSRKYQSKVEADFKEGQAAGVRGTPGSFVNGVSVSGAVPYSALKAQIETAISNL